MISTVDNKHKRMVWIDVVKAMAIFLVLWGHCIQHLVSDFVNNPVFLFICSFHMPLFMAMSGFFAYKLIGRRLKVVIVPKFLQLILPAILFSILIWIQCRILNQTEKSILQALWYYFWFLKSLFVCVILFYVAIKVFKKRWIGLMTMFLVSQFLAFIPHLYFLQLGYMFPCFIFGYILNCHKEYFYRYAKVIAPLCIVIFMLLFAKFDKEVCFVPYLFNNSLQIGGGKWLIFICYKLLIGIIGSLGVMSVIYIVCRKLQGNKTLGLLARAGQYTLAIYILQAFLVESWLRWFFSFSVLPCSCLFSMVYAPFISFIGVLLSILIYRCLCKIKLDWMFDFNRYPFRLWK